MVDFSTVLVVMFKLYLRVFYFIGVGLIRYLVGSIIFCFSQCNCFGNGLMMNAKII